MIVVNPTTRQFNIPGAELVFGVTADSGAARKEFQCPRYVGDKLDLTGCFIRMNYQNANGEIDSYLVSDVTVSGDNIVFSWALSPKVTMYRGNISFVMCATGPDTKIKWHTTLGRGQVLEGLEPDSHIVEEGTIDVVAQLIAMVEAQTKAVADTGVEWVRNVQAEGTDQIVAVQTAGEESMAAAVAEIEAKRTNSLASIPADYTALGNAVEGLVRGRAGAIVCEAEGTAIAVKDASNLAVQGLRIFGRSTQNGVPTPQSPVEIVSVESPVVTMSGKNLFPGHVKNYTGTDGTTVKVNSDGSLTVHKVAGAVISFRAYVTFPAGTYTISNGLSEGHPVYLQVFSVALYDASSKVVEWPGGETSVFIYARETTEGDVTLFPQIEVGSVATAYEPYKTAQTVETIRPLRGIPVTTDGNYTDENGQQWICDEVDLARGVHVQRVAVHEPVEIQQTSVLSNGLAYGVWNVFDKRSVSRVGLLSTVATYVTSSRAAENTCYENPANVVFVGSATDTKETLKEKFDGSTIYYVLRDPIETPLSETEIAAYRALRTYKPNTTILNDSGAHMKVEYAADTKLYIDNKLAALVGNT